MPEDTTGMGETAYSKDFLRVPVGDTIAVVFVDKGDGEFPVGGVYASVKDAETMFAGQRVVIKEYREVRTYNDEQAKAHLEGGDAPFSAPRLPGESREGVPFNPVETKDDPKVEEPLQDKAPSADSNEVGAAIQPDKEGRIMPPDTASKTEASHAPDKENRLKTEEAKTEGSAKPKASSPSGMGKADVSKGYKGGRAKGVRR